MHFEEADTLCTRIIEFMREQGGPYEDADESELTWVILMALATQQYDMREDEKGIVYFICWWWLDKESLEDFLSLDPNERIQPESICCGPYLYGADCVARKGHGFEMVRKLKSLFKDKAASINWHRAKKNVKVVSFTRST